MAVNTVTRSDLNRTVAMIFGWILVAVGLIGFVWDPVLFVFDVGLAHNLVHLLSGAVLLAAAYINNGEYARTTNLVLGITYALVTLLGFLTPSLLASIIDYGWDGTTPVWAIWDNWLHLLLTVVFLGAAFAGRQETTVRRGTAAP